MDELILKLSDGSFLHMQLGSDNVGPKACYIDYTTYKDGEAQDGGQLDCKEDEEGWSDIHEAIQDILEFAEVNHLEWEILDIDLEDFEERGCK